MVSANELIERPARRAKRSGRHWLTALDARRAKPGKHADGGGLYLMVRTTTQRWWLLRYTLRGKSHDVSLGSFDQVSLAEARAKATAFHQQIDQGVDPLAVRRAQEEAAKVEQARGTNFATAAEAYIAAHEAEWRNAKHRQQWRNTLATYALPTIGGLPCAEVTTDHIEALLQPIWTDKPETAARVRGRIEIVLDYAKARSWRDGPNPAVWRGNLKMRLAALHRSRTIRHHAALDWHEGHSFMQALRARDSFGARALEFAILTAARSGEVRGARWDEIDLDHGTWIIPGERMKGGREYRVPLSLPALLILRQMAELKDGSGLIFLGVRKDVPLSDMTLIGVLRRMGRGDLTAHGFRSTFSDWAHETTRHEHIVIEAALAHVSGDKVASAYHRGDLFEKRKALMADWAAFLARKPAEIVRLPKEQSANRLAKAGVMA